MDLIEKRIALLIPSFIQNGQDINQNIHYIEKMRFLNENFLHTIIGQFYQKKKRIDQEGLSSF